MVGKYGILQEIGPNARHSKATAKTNLSPTESEFDTPLAERLVRRYQTPRNVADSLSAKASHSLGEGEDSNSLPKTPRKNKAADNTALMTSNLDTTVRPRKGNSKSYEFEEVAPNVKSATPSAKHDDTLKVNETADESPVLVAI